MRRAGSYYSPVVPGYLTVEDKKAALLSQNGYCHWLKIPP
jgi:hypothetical protein